MIEGMPAPYEAPAWNGVSVGMGAIPVARTGRLQEGRCGQGLRVIIMPGLQNDQHRRQPWARRPCSINSNGVHRQLLCPDCHERGLPADGEGESSWPRTTGGCREKYVVGVVQAIPSHCAAPYAHRQDALLYR